MTRKDQLSDVSEPVSDPVEPEAVPERGCRLSVVIATHNRPGLLPRAVASALTGLPEDAEIVVVDDGSTEWAGDVLADLVPANGQLRILRHTGPNGAARAEFRGGEGEGHDHPVSG